MLQALGYVRQLILEVYGRALISAHRSRVRFYARDPKGGALNSNRRLLPESRDKSWKMSLEKYGLDAFLNGSCGLGGEENFETLDLLETVNASNLPLVQMDKVIVELPLEDVGAELQEFYFL